jgi:sec-independent protein translocase protein TatC
MALVPFPERRTDEETASHAPQAGVTPEIDTAGEHPRSPFVGESAEPEEPAEGRMTFLEHLDELRKRITHSVVALLVGFLIAFAFRDYVFSFIYERLVADVPGRSLIYTEPGEAFFIYLKMSALCGLLIASPYVMWQVWLFIAPGLYANEKKFALPFVFFASTLFISGAAFSHYILFPLAWKFFAGFSNEFLEFMPRVAPIFGLYVKLLLAMGLVFQLPMLIFVLARFGIVSARFLIKNFKYAVLIFFVVSAIITPDGSFVPQIIMAVAMTALYGVSIGVAWIFGKKKRDDDETNS